MTFHVGISYSSQAMAKVQLSGHTDRQTHQGQKLYATWCLNWRHKNNKLTLHISIGVQGVWMDRITDNKTLLINCTILDVILGNLRVSYEKNLGSINQNSANMEKGRPIWKNSANTKFNQSELRITSANMEISNFHFLTRWPPLLSIQLLIFRFQRDWTLKWFQFKGE